MRKAVLKFGICVLVIMSVMAVCPRVHADVDWTLVKQANLGVQPLDIATSDDGQLIFVLAKGEILVYSIAQDKVTNRIPIDKGFDRITYAGRINALILTGGPSKSLKVILVETIQNIVIDGHPVKGPPDAPVTIAVFDDYQ